MQTKAKWFLALLVGGLFAAPALIAQSQPRKIPRLRGKGQPVHITRTTTASPSTVNFSGGSFQMGSNEGDNDARPAHTASVAPFKLMRREVTTTEYKKCVDAGKCTPPGATGSCNWGKSGRGGHPINCVDYYQATNYCSFVGMRLPTEQEWEFAAKQPDNRIYPWGPAPATTQACWKKTSTCTVGAHPTGRSGSGLDDMSGNVAEWTASPFCAYQSGGCTTTQRAVRGGGWSLAVATELQTSGRTGFNKGVRSATIGIRCAGAATQ